MIPLPLTALHDTLKAGDEPCTVLVTVTPWTLEGGGGAVGDVVGVGAGEGAKSGGILLTIGLLYVNQLHHRNIMIYCL